MCIKRHGSKKTTKWVELAIMMKLKRYDVKQYVSTYNTIRWKYFDLGVWNKSNLAGRHIVLCVFVWNSDWVGDENLMFF